MKSIKILGAGIAGLTAAINLAKAGYKVEVFERNKDVGMRFGGDFQGLENWSEKEDILESMRFAVVSGFLAAQSIIKNQDYEKLAKAHFGKKLKSSLVNRFIWETVGLVDYSFLISKAKKNKNLFGSLYSFHNYNFLQKIIYPVALVYMRKKYPKLKL